MTNTVSILIVEDEPAIRDMIRLSLDIHGYSVTAAGDCREANNLIYDKKPDLILMDWMLPGMSGVDFVKKLKGEESTAHIPIIMLTAKAEEGNKIKGFEVGADDYVTKPFSPKELIARIKAVLRRGPPIPVDGRIQFKEMTIDVNHHIVTVQGTEIPLPLMLFKLLHFFVTHIERIFSRDQILNQVWQNDASVFERTVDVQIRRLRKELTPFGYDRFIRTVHGMGYKFSDQI